MIRLPDQLGLPALGAAAPPHALLTDVARAALRDERAEVVTAAAAVVAYPFTSIATGGLWGSPAPRPPRPGSARGGRS